MARARRILSGLPRRDASPEDAVDAPRPQSGHPMTRRDLLVLLAASFVCGSPLPAAAQRADRMRHIAVLMSYVEADSEAQTWVAAFRTALRELGWTEGRNIRIDIGWATSERETIGRRAKE